MSGTNPRQWKSSAMGQAYRRWLAGDLGPDGQQMALPGMPEPPTHPVYRLFPFLLVTMADKNGRLSPGWAYLARVAGLHPKSVQRHVRRMVTDGWLVIESPGHRGHRAIYLLVTPPWVTEKGVHPMTPYGGPGGRERGTPGDRKGVHPMTPLLGKELGEVDAEGDPDNQGPPPGWLTDDAGPAGEVIP